MVAGSPGWGRGDSGRARMLIRREVSRFAFDLRRPHLCGAPRALQGPARDPFHLEDRHCDACALASLGGMPPLIRWNYAPQAGEADLRLALRGGRGKGSCGDS